MHAHYDLRQESRKYRWSLLTDILNWTELKGGAGSGAKLFRLGLGGCEEDASNFLGFASQLILPSGTPQPKTNHLLDRWACRYFGMWVWGRMTAYESSFEHKCWPPFSLPWRPWTGQLLVQGLQGREKGTSVTLCLLRTMSPSQSPKTYGCCSNSLRTSKGSWAKHTSPARQMWSTLRREFGFFNWLNRVSALGEFDFLNIHLPLPCVPGEKSQSCFLPLVI